MSLKLLSVTLPATDKPRGITFIRTLDLENPVIDAVGWQVLIRGPAVILASKSDGKGERKLYEFARSQCVLAWSGAAEDADKLQKYDSPVLKRPNGADDQADSKGEKK